MNEDTLNTDGGLFEVLCLRSEGVALVVRLFSVVVASVDVIDVTSNEKAAEKEERRSVLLNGNGVFGLLDEFVTIAGVAEDELAAGADGTLLVVAGFEVVCINFFAVTSNLARRLEA